MKLLNTAAAAALAAATLAGPALAQDYSDHRVVLSHAEILTDPLSGEAGRVEWFQQDTGNGQLGSDFVYDDPRAAWDAFKDVSIGIKYANTSNDVNLENQGYWFEQGSREWTAETCSGLNPVYVTSDSSRPGLVENFFATGILDLGLIGSDLTIVGFKSAAEFPYFAANPNVLGVAFTLTWVDGSGFPTDIDNNGKTDVAFREIYYNDEFEWADNGVEGRQPDGTRVFDFPAVSVHENGHGLSAAHFGSIGVQDGFLVARPAAVMNAIYGGGYDGLTGRDAGSHCSNWAQWPTN